MSTTVIFTTTMKWQTASSDVAAFIKLELYVESQRYHCPALK